MLSKINSFGLIGLDGYLIDVEVDVNHGLPAYNVVGLADTAIKESKERVASAIKNQGFNFPVEKITINLAPADTKKEGSIYDLPIAVGVLAASNQLEIKKEELKSFSFVGELSLDGSLRKINGILPILITARNKGIKKVVIPYDNQNEASFIEGLEVYAIKNLRELYSFFKKEINLQPIDIKSYVEIRNSAVPKFDFSQ